MAELGARSADGAHGWKNTLPPSGEVIIGKGRPPTLAPDVPFWPTPWERFASALHARLQWNRAEGRLIVRAWDDPPPVNPILLREQGTGEFRVRAASAFALPPDDEFRIGETTFTFTDRDYAEAVVPEGELGEVSLVQVRKATTVALVEAEQRIKALARLPELIRRERTPAQLDQTLLDALLDGIPGSTRATLVQLSATDGQAAPAVRLSRHRDPSKGLVDEPPDKGKLSRRLVREAIRHGLPKVATWNEGALSEHMFTQPSPENGWAFCIPLRYRDLSDRALFVSGSWRLPHATAKEAAASPELRGHLSFAALAADIYRSLRQLLEQEQRLKVLGNLLSPQILREFEGADLAERLAARPAELTVLFCDLRGFSKLTEARRDNLSQTWTIISRALGIMTRAILEQNGVIGDFQGDAAMGFWGWPKAPLDQIERALQAAQSIRERFEEASRDTADPLAGFTCGIGLAHGPAIAGLLGTMQQQKVSVFGDIVNLASRLEALTKSFRVPVLVDESVADHPSIKQNKQFRLRRLARIRPYGLEKPVTVSQLLGGQDMTPESVHDYEAALTLFLDGKWSDAVGLLDPLAGDAAADLLWDFIHKRGRNCPPSWGENNFIPLESKSPEIPPRQRPGSVVAGHDELTPSRLE